MFTNFNKKYSLNFPKIQKYSLKTYTSRLLFVLNWKTLYLLNIKNNLQFSIQFDNIYLVGC